MVKRIIQFHQMFSFCGPQCKAIHFALQYENIFAKPSLLVIQPLSLPLSHPQSSGRKQDKCTLTKKRMWYSVNSFWTRRKKKWGKPAPYMMKGWWREKRKAKKRKGDRHVCFSVSSSGMKTQGGWGMLDHLKGELRSKGSYAPFSNWKIRRRLHSREVSE